MKDIKATEGYEDMFDDIVDFDYTGKTHIKMDPLSKLNSQYKHGDIEPVDVMRDGHQ